MPPEPQRQRWASAISEALTMDRALDETTAALDAQLGGARPDLVLAFVSPAYAGEVARLPEALSRWHRGALVAGCTGGGVAGGGREIELRAALSVVAAHLPGVRLAATHAPQDALPPDASGWHERLALPVPPRALLVLADPLTCDAEALVGLLDEAFPGVPKIGGLASGGVDPTATALLLGSALHPTGALVIALGGALRLEARIAQGCRPVGPPFIVTSAVGNVIRQLNDRPVAEVLKEVYESLDEADQALSRKAMMIGLAMDPEATQVRPGDFLIRNIIGFDASGGGMVVATPRVEPLQVVQFHLRDARAARDDLEAVLAPEPSAPPAGILHFTCLGRGTPLYGEPDHESRALQARFPGAPAGGFFCAGEIGPVRGRTHVHGYTAAIGLFSGAP